MSAMVTYYLIRELLKHGHPTKRLRYNLSYSQGDGVAWCGPISQEAAIFKAETLLKGQIKAAAKRAINKGCRVYVHDVGASSTTYDHYNNMSVNGDDSNSEPLTLFEEEALIKLIQVVGEEVRILSQQLEYYSYRIRAAGSEYFGVEARKRTFSTERFTLTIEETPGEDFCLDLLEQEYLEEILEKVVSGDTRYFGLQVSITDKASGLELGKEFAPGVSAEYNLLNNPYRRLTRQLVAEAVGQARSNIAISSNLKPYLRLATNPITKTSARSFNVK